MRLFVLGATGRTGTEILDLALARGHEVTAFVRSPDKIVRRDKGLHVVKGDPRDADGMAKAMKGRDAVLSALGPSPREVFWSGTTLLHDSALATTAAMKTAGVKKGLIVSSGLLFPGGGPMFAFFRFLMRSHVSELRKTEKVLQESGLDWTIARPPRLVRTKDERYASLEDAVPPGASAMSFRAVAVFMLDAVEKGAHARKVVGLGR